MNNNKISQQIHALFGIFMVVFYLGVGIFLLFFADRFFIIDKAIRGIIGSTFLLYGFYRVYVTYKQIVEAFFTKGTSEE
jgi:hypothetical protein